MRAARTDDQTIHQIDQLGELYDAMQGEITGAYVLVQLPDGTTVRAAGIEWRGTTGSAMDPLALVLHVNPNAMVPHHSHDHPVDTCIYCIAPDSVLARAAVWQEHRDSLGQREADGQEVHPDDWHGSDDEAADLVPLLVASLQEVTGAPSWQS